MDNARMLSIVRGLIYLAFCFGIFTVATYAYQGAHLVECDALTPGTCVADTAPSTASAGQMWIPLAIVTALLLVSAVVLIRRRWGVRV